MTSSVTSFVQKFRKFKNSPKLHLWTDLHNSGCKWKILDDTTILYSLFTFFMPMTSYYDVIKSLKIQNRLWRHKICHMGRITKILFFLKSTPQDGHFEVLIIQFGSKTKKIQWNLVTVRISGHSVKPHYIKFRIIWRFLYISTTIHIALLLLRLSLILDRCVYI